MKIAEFKDLKNIPGLLIDLRYAGTNNFMHRNVYGDFRQALLHPMAYAKLEVATANLSVYILAASNAVTKNGEFLDNHIPGNMFE